MYEDLKDKINEASEKMPPLYIGIGSVAVYRCETQKKEFGGCDPADVWDFLEQLFDTSMKAGVEEDDIDGIMQILVKGNFKQAEKRLHNLIVHTKDKQPEELPDQEKPKLNGKKKQFRIPTPPDSEDEEEQEEEQKNQKSAGVRQKKQDVNEFGLNEEELEMQRRYFEQQEENDLKTQELIEELKKQDEEEAEKRRQKLLEQGESICKICYMGIQEEIFPLQNCEHLFHRECLEAYLQNQINEGKFPIKCAEAECGKEITIGDIRDIVNEEMQEKFYKFSFNTYVAEHPKEVSCCPTADCNFHFYWDNEDGKEFDCPECKSKYCLDCKADWHEGQTCEEYKVSNRQDENDAKFDKFVKGQNFKKCPHCGFWVERLYGCEFIVCKCGQNFCYLCGKHHPGMHFCPDKNKFNKVRPVLFQRPRKKVAPKRKAPVKRAPAKRAPAKKTAAKRETRATGRKKK